jgi:hypothetical protein
LFIARHPSKKSENNKNSSSRTLAPKESARPGGQATAYYFNVSVVEGERTMLRAKRRFRRFSAA